MTKFNYSNWDFIYWLINLINSAMIYIFQKEILLYINLKDVKMFGEIFFISACEFISTIDDNILLFSWIFPIFASSLIQTMAVLFVVKTMNRNELEWDSKGRLIITWYLLSGHLLINWEGWVKTVDLLFRLASISYAPTSLFFSLSVSTFVYLLLLLFVPISLTCFHYFYNHSRVTRCCRSLDMLAVVTSA